MASSSTGMLVALLVAFAVVAPSLPPSAAARDGGAAKDAAAAPAPSAAVHPMDIFDDINHIIHFDLPLPRILPCPPVFPKIPFIPCYNYTPSPSSPPTPPAVPECRSALAKYITPCAGVLTDGGAPFNHSSKCCGTIQPFFSDNNTTLSCLCHVINGDAGEILHAPVNRTRALSYLNVCGFGMTPDMFTQFCDDSPVPPMDAPKPPPRRRQGTKD